MAEVLKSFEFHVKNNKYPWHEWQNGEIWQVTEGKDFPIEAKAFVIALRNKAHCSNMTIRTNVDGKNVVFQFLPKAATNGHAPIKKPARKRAKR